MLGNLGFSRLENRERSGVTGGPEFLGSMTPATLLVLQVTSQYILPASWSQSTFSGTPPSQATLPHSVLCTYSSLRLPLSSPLSKSPALQQALVGALLVSLVGDVGQVDAAEGRAVVQHNVAHTEAQDISLQPLLQVLQEPEGSASGQGQSETPDLGTRPIAGSDPPPQGQAIPSPLAGALDLGQFGKQPLLVLRPQTLAQLSRA